MNSFRSDHTTPTKENGRREALRRFRILEGVPEKTFDQISALATSLFGVEAALIAFSDGDRQWFKLTEGAGEAVLGQADASLALTFSAQTLESREVTVVEDTTKDERFKGHPLLAGEASFRFYAGAPLRTPDGHVIGTLSVLGVEAHSPSSEKLKRLQDLASMAARELDLRREVEERRHAEQGVRDREERLQSIVQNIQEGIFRSTPKEGLIFANQAFAELFGYENHEEVLALDPVDLYPDVAERRRLIRLAEEHGELDGVEARFRRKDGSVFPGLLSCRVVYGEEGEAVYYDGLVTDISDRKEREQRLQESERRFEAVFEDPQTLVGILTPDGTLLSANQTALACIGADSEEVSGKPLWETPWWSEEMYPEVRHWIERAASGEYVEYEANHPGPGGGPHSVEGIMRPITDEEGEVVSLIVTARDVTDRKKKVRELREAKEEAEKANRTKSALLANMSHEIRTPLTSIIGFAEAIGDLIPTEEEVSPREVPFGEASPRDVSREEAARGVGAPGDASKKAGSPESFSGQEASDIQRFAHLIVKSGRRLLETLNSVMDFSRLEAGSMELEPEPVDVVAEAEEVADLFARRAREQEITLAKNVQDSPLWARADRGALQRVLQNLLSNAVKFTDPGGKISLRAWEEAAAVVIEVEDTGSGIDPEFVPHLFDAFKQEADGEGRTQDGSGLGLAVTKQLLTRMGGEISVDTEVGEGTCFTVRLPRTKGRGRTPRA